MKLVLHSKYPHPHYSTIDIDYNSADKHFRLGMSGSSDGGYRIIFHEDDLPKIIKALQLAYDIRGLML